MALVLLDSVLSRQPGNRTAVYLAGACYNQLNQPQKALAVLETIRNLQSADYLLVFEKGNAFTRLGQTREALAAYEQVITWQPAFAGAYSARGDLMREQGQNTNDALNWYVRALERDSLDSKNYYWAGWCSNDLGRFEQAATYLTKAAGQRSSFQALAFAELGFSYYSLKNYQLALDFLRKARNLQEDLDVTRYYLGLCYVQMGDKQAAVREYNALVLAKSSYAATLLEQIKTMK